MNSLVIISLPDSEVFATRVAQHLNRKILPVKHTQFADGNWSHKPENSIREADVYIIGSIHGEKPVGSAVRLETLCYSISAAKLASAKRVTAVITYFEGREDRKSQSRIDIVAARWARQIRKSGADRVITMDLHSAQIAGFFYPIPVDHLYGSYNILPLIRKMRIPNMVLVSPDSGGSARIEKYGKYLDVDGLAFISKRRPGANVVDNMRLSGEVAKKNIIILDDLCDGGGTIKLATEVLRNAGAHDIHAICIHGLLSGEAVEKIRFCELKSFTTTNTIPHQNLDKIVNQISVTRIFAKAIYAAHTGHSISKLFIETK